MTETVFEDFVKNVETNFVTMQNDIKYGTVQAVSPILDAESLLKITTDLAVRTVRIYENFLKNCEQGEEKFFLIYLFFYRKKAKL